MTIEKLTEKDADFMAAFCREHWRADFIVTRGRKVHVKDSETWIARDELGKCLGVVTCEFRGDQCEVVSLDALDQHKGIGTKLMDFVREECRRRRCQRLWLITTNDNLEALRFYQRRGFTISAIHIDAIANSRKTKLTIPLVGKFQIPIRDEIELDLKLN